MNPFAAALDAIFASPMAEDAVYTPVGGDDAAVRIILSRPDQEVGFGNGTAVLASYRMELRRSDASAPQEGDQLQLLTEGGAPRADMAFAISSEPMIDVEGLTWSFDVELIAA